MSTILDIISSAIVAGIVLLLMLNVRSTMVESNIENRMIQNLQGLADATVQLIHDDIKSLVEFDEVTDSTIRFINTEGEEITIERSGGSLCLHREFPDGRDPAKRMENVFLQSLRFELVDLPSASHGLIRIRVICEVDNEFNQSEPLIAFAQQDVFLRNLYLPKPN
jgi:hypothetical protein